MQALMVRNTMVFSMTDMTLLVYFTYFEKPTLYKD